MPLALPALVGGFILAFLHSLSLFGAPAILGLPAGIHTITTQIWALFQYPPRLDMAAAFSVPLLLATMVLIALQKKILGRRGFSTVGGKGGQKRLIRFGWWRVPVLLLVLGILSLSVFLPYWILLKAALSNAWAMPLTWDNFTLKNFSFAFFEYGDTQRAIFNTFKLGILTATLGTLVATLIAYITNRNLFRGARYLSFFALAPLVIPGIVLAVGLFIAYTKPPLVLYGTIWILFVAYLTKEMPIGFSQAESTFKSIHPELEDASRIIGANRLISLKDVTAPLGALRADRRLVVHLHRRDSRAQRLDSALRSGIQGGLGSDLRSKRGRAGRGDLGPGHSFVGSFLRGDSGHAMVRGPRRGGDERVAHGHRIASTG